MASFDAREILQTLVQGFDPSTGAELPAGTVVHQAEVIRALLAAIAALEADAERTRRRAQLPRNVGRPWSAEEEARLEAAFRSGEAVAAIAARHHRTVAAIEARLERLGLITTEQRTTRNRYVTRTEAAGKASRPGSAAPAGQTPQSHEGASAQAPRSSAGARAERKR